MSEDIALPRRARWPWITGAVIIVAAAAAWWAFAPDEVGAAPAPAASPSPSITLRAADPAAGAVRAAEEAEAPTVDPVDPAPTSDDGAVDGGTLATLDDASGQQAYDAGTAAVLATVTQPVDETADQRRERLAGLFAPQSPTPAAAPAVDLAGLGVTSLGRVDAVGIVSAEPFDPGDGRVGFLVSVTAQSYGVRNGGTGDVAWKDTSTQMWKVLLVNDDGVWVPQVAYLADQPEPTGVAG